MSLLVCLLPEIDVLYSVRSGDWFKDSMSWLGRSVPFLVLAKRIRGYRGCCHYTHKQLPQSSGLGTVELRR